MPLSVLGPLVVLGIALVVLLVWGLGLSRPVKLDEDAARAAYLREFPDEAPGGAAVIVSDDGRAALIGLPGALGVVEVFGDATVARRLGPGEAEALETAEGLRLTTPDLGAPAFDLAFAGAEGRAAAAALARARLDGVEGHA